VTEELAVAVAVLMIILLVLTADVVVIAVVEVVVEVVVADAGDAGVIKKRLSLKKRQLTTKIANDVTRVEWNWRYFKIK
jgi:hypothetical protein